MFGDVKKKGQELVFHDSSVAVLLAQRGSVTSAHLFGGKLT